MTTCDDAIFAANLTDQTLELTKWESYQSTLLIIILMLCGMTDIGGKSLFLHYIRTYAPKNRPINKMFAKDQIVQVVSSSINTVLVLTSLISGKALPMIFGSDLICWIHWASLVVHNVNITTGGLAMAIYRIYCLRSSQGILAANKLCSWLIAGELAANVFLVTNVWIGTYMANTSMSMQFCRGQKELLSQVISLHSGSTQDHFNIRKNVIIINIILGQICICMELGIYIYLFYFLHANNIRNPALSLDMKKAKLRRNGITLSGQVMSFLVEIIVTVGIQMLIGFKVVQIEPAVVSSVVQIIFSSCVTLCHILASCELRNHYFRFDNFII